MLKKRYVLLEGIKEGNKFFTANTLNPTKLADGTVAYTIIGYADTAIEAQSKLYPTKEDLDDAVRKHLEPMNIGDVDKLISIIKG